MSFTDLVMIDSMMKDYQVNEGTGQEGSVEFWGLVTKLHRDPNMFSICPRDTSLYQRECGLGLWCPQYLIIVHQHPQDSGPCLWTSVLPLLLSCVAQPVPRWQQVTVQL